MFGSRIVNQVIYETLTATPALTDIVGNRVHRGVAYPAGTTLPAVLFYMEASAYDEGGSRAVGSEYLTGEELRFVVRVDDIGTSDTRIADAAQAQLDALAGLIVDKDGYQVIFSAQGEVPLTSYVDGDTFYQRLGTIYTVHVTAGG